MDQYVSEQLRNLVEQLAAEKQQEPEAFLSELLREEQTRRIGARSGALPARAGELSSPVPRLGRKTALLGPKDTFELLRDPLFAVRYLASYDSTVEAVFQMLPDWCLQLIEYKGYSEFKKLAEEKGLYPHTMVRHFEEFGSFATDPDEGLPERLKP